MSNLHLPNEILAIIINKLAESEEDDARTLACCRLVSYSLYSLATPLVFSSVRLSGCSLTLREQAIKFNEILTTNQDISASVRTLKLRCHNMNYEDSINGTLLSTILHRLPHIRHFFLEPQKVPVPERLYLRFMFSEIVGNLASAIRALCSSPNLITLGVKNVDRFPIAIIASCPNLRYLCLSDCSQFDFNLVLQAPSRTQFFYLDSLEIEDWKIYTLRKDVSGLFTKHLSRIKNLRLHLFDSNPCTPYFKCRWDIISLASQTLTTLDLLGSRLLENQGTIIRRKHLRAIVPFDLGRLPALRHLKFQLPILSPNDHTDMRYLLSRLLYVSSQSGIETLKIELSWFKVTDEDGYYNDCFSPDTGWSTLDEILTSEDKFISLRKVILNLDIQFSLESERNGIHCEVDALFPKLRASTSFRLEIHVTFS